MPTLKSKLHDLARTFAEQVIGAIRGSSLQELVSSGEGAIGNGRRARVVAGGGGQPDPLSVPKKGKPGRLRRRSEEDIQAALSKIVLLVKTQKTGLRAEGIRAKLGMLPREMPRILKQGLAAKKLTSRGNKRATTYFVK